MNTKRPNDPRSSRTARLQERLAEIDSAIADVEARHAADIADANTRVERAQEEARRAHDVAAIGEGHILDLGDLIESFRRQLATAEADRREAEATHLVLAQDCVRADVAHAAEVAARAQRLDEPNRHTAALRTARERVAYRLQLHEARAPHTALFTGVVP